MSAQPPARPVDEATERLLRRRATAWARPEQDDRATATTELLTLAVGDQLVALPPQRVREVLPPGAVARVPGAGGAARGPLVGVRVVRGDILAVAELAPLLGLPTTTAVSEGFVVALHHASAPLGVLVDAAVGLTEVPTEALADREGDTTQRLVSAIAAGGVLVLDADALLEDPRLFTDPGSLLADGSGPQTDHGA